MINLALTVTEDHDANWRLIINGGARQEIGQVHGRLLVDESNHSDFSFGMTDPVTEFGRWEQLFHRVAAADAIAGNGYSVTFHLSESEEMLATFSEPKPT